MLTLMGAIVSYLSNFSGSFKAALVAWPFLSFALTLPILALLYHRDGRLKATTALAAYVSVLYLAGLACFTLYPLPSGDSGLGITYGIAPQLNPLNFIVDIQKDGLKAVLQQLFNIVLFVPFGFIAKALLRLGPVPTFALSLLATGLIETAQLTGLFGIYPFAYRTFEVDDIIMNVLGGMLGWLCAALVAKAIPQRPEEKPPITHDPGFVRRAIALWIDAMILGFCTLMPWLVASLTSEFAFHRACLLPGLSLDQTASAMFIVCFVASFVVVEVLIPWMHEGSTPGGMFVRMSCETRPRTGGLRIGFYAARTITLLVIFAFPVTAFALAVFYLFARCMPYDLIP